MSAKNKMWADRMDAMDAISRCAGALVTGFSVTVPVTYRNSCVDRAKELGYLINVKDCGEVLDGHQILSFKRSI